MSLRNLIQRYTGPGIDHEAFAAEQTAKLKSIKETLDCLIETVEQKNRQAQMDGEGKWFLKMVQLPMPDSDPADVHFDTEEDRSCLKVAGTP